MKKLILIKASKIINLDAPDFKEVAKLLRIRFTKDSNISILILTSSDNDLVKYGQELSKHNFSYKNEIIHDEKPIGFAKRIKERFQEYDYIIGLFHYVEVELLEILSIVENSCGNVKFVEDVKNYCYYLEFEKIDV
ncbi:MAG: hypothetical protein WC755_08275 [Candidatus Woesearchaeota archaeon]|jgi:hypothetical protein